MAEISIRELTFHHRLARLFDQSGGGDFWAALARFLQGYIAFNAWTAMVFYHDRPPLLLADGGDDLDEFDDKLYLEYSNGLYVLDPFFQISNVKCSPGVYTLKDVSPENFLDTEYYKKYFVHNVVGDEIQLLQNGSDGGVISLSLSTQGNFSEEEIGILNLFSPWLLNLMRGETAGAQETNKTVSAPQNHQPLDQWLHTRAATPLTDREVQTTLLILAGHSAKAIAAQMGISTETVKTHKRHLYRKFGVSSPAALFALYLETEK